MLRKPPKSQKPSWNAGTVLKGAFCVGVSLFVAARFFKQKPAQAQAPQPSQGINIPMPPSQR